MESRLIAGGLLAMASVLPSPAIANRVINLICDNGGKVSIRELYDESTHRYSLGDLIEVRLEGERFEGEPYRMVAAGTASFGGRWVYPGPPSESFSLLRSGRSDFWWVDHGDLGRWTCVESNR
jgi:hypothetical protein